MEYMGCLDYMYWSESLRNKFHHNPALKNYRSINSLVEEPHSSDDGSSLPVILILLCGSTYINLNVVYPTGCTAVRDWLVLHWQCS